MARCSKKKGIWVVRQCENAAFTTCTACGQPACTEHLSVGASQKYICTDCLRSYLPNYAVEDFYSGEVGNYLYYFAKLKGRLDRIIEENSQLGIKPIPIESLYNFTKYDSLSFRQEYVQYYDDNDFSGNLYDS